MLNQKERRKKHLISRNTKNYFEFSFNCNRIETRNDFHLKKLYKSLKSRCKILIVILKKKL